MIFFMLTCICVTDSKIKDFEYEKSIKWLNNTDILWKWFDSMIENPTLRLNKMQVEIAAESGGTIKREKG